MCDQLKSLLHPRADAGEVGQLQVHQLAREVLATQDGEPVRFLHVGRDLGEEPVRAEPDRAPHPFPGPVEDRPLDPPGDGDRVLLVPVIAHQRANHFIDRQDGLHRQDRLDGRDDDVVLLDVQPRPGRD